MLELFQAETSLYLRQHADNPVDWWPWCDEAFATAIKRDCPVLLSIGYASCHWCHVMAHESFEDDVTAAQMNADFVNIKVDREERPDVDQVYQRLHQMIHQSAGGWPLTAFVDPNSRMPFLTGTYFPSKSRYQMPAFSEVMRVMADAWMTRRHELTARSTSMQAALKKLVDPPIRLNQLPDLNAVLQLGKKNLLQMADTVTGGFGPAPKFPMFTSLALLLECAYYEPSYDAETAEHLRRSLIGMARGGLFDHVGGGFFRYSVDDKWLIPHFEKMLYDNAQHLSLYAEALPLINDGLLTQTVNRTAAFLRDEMQLKEGGYCASIDADSEGAEGSYYVWQKQEVVALLDDDAYALAEMLYGFDQPAQFEGAWHLHRQDSWPGVLRRLDLDEAKGCQLLEQIWTQLHQARTKRVAPVRDEKIIVAWNGLAIKGMVQAAKALDEHSYYDSACRALDFIRTNMWNGTLLSGVYDQDTLKPQAFLDDYACLLDAILSMMAYRWRSEDVEMALLLTDEVMRNFPDQNEGGFLFTSAEDAPLPARHKPIDDNMVPCANALLATSLYQLGHLFARTDLLDTAHATLHSVAAVIDQHPAHHASLALALRAIKRRETTVIIFGPKDELAERQAWLKGYPNVNSFAIPVEEPRPIPEYLDAAAAAHETQIYLCYRLACQPPCTKRYELAAMLEQEKYLD